MPVDRLDSGVGTFTVRTSVQFEPWMAEALASLARRDSTSMASILRRLLTPALESEGFERPTPRETVEAV